MGLLSDFREMESQIDVWRVVGNVLLHSVLTMVPVGYEIICLNVPQAQFLSRINSSHIDTYGSPPSELLITIEWSSIVSAQALGAFFGCFFVSFVVQNYGTKHALMVLANAFLAAGCIIMAVSGFSFWMLFVGRFIVGIHSGLAPSILAIYIGQISPSRIAGGMGCFIHIGILIGTGVGGILSLDSLLGSIDRLNYLLLMPAFFALVQLAVSGWYPDVPNELLRRQQLSNARQSMHFYFGKETYTVDMMARLQAEQEQALPQMSMWAVIKDSDLHKPLFVGCVVTFTQIFTGGMAVITYTTVIFESIGFNNLAVLAILPMFIAVASLVLSAAAIYFVERFGRRPMLLWTNLTCSLCVYVVFAAILVFELVQGPIAPWVVAIALVVFASSYNLGTGPISYFLAGELVPIYAKSAALGLALATNWFSTMLSLLLFYPLEIYTGAFAFLIFAIPTSVTVIYLYFNLEESKPIEEETSEDRLIFASLQPPSGSGGLPGPNGSNSRNYGAMSDIDSAIDVK